MMFRIILGIAAILIAVYNFDIYNFNRTLVAVLLFMTGVLTLSQNKKFNKIVRNITVALAIFLIMKLLITG